MSVGVIIPFRGLGLGKTRLRAALPGSVVDTLSERMLTNVLRAVCGAVGKAPVAVITQSMAGLSLTQCAVTVIEQPLQLNQAIEFARKHLAEHSVNRVAVVPSDLPLIQARDIEALLAPSHDVVIAPDARGEGTNGLIFPTSEPFFTHFGANSARLHAAEAAARRLTFTDLHTARWARDVDTADQIDAPVLTACQMSHIDNAAGPSLGKARARQGA